ncbi:MAG: hypothetical protein DI538_03140 [Azospira oryzae]|nr:MAG: hypothetical protein DI538_03140 [Azospira oryzae]
MISEVQKNLEIHTMEFGGLGFTCGGKHEGCTCNDSAGMGCNIKKLERILCLLFPQKICVVYKGDKQC